MGFIVLIIALRGKLKMTLKYNVGDKVIDLKKLIYLDDHFHCDITFNAIETVRTVDVKDGLFSIDKDGFDCWDSRHFFQSNGMCVARSSFRVLLHLIKDREEITKQINDYYIKAMKEEDEEVKKAIIHSKDIITYHQKRIKELKEKGRLFCKNYRGKFITENKNKLLELIEKSSNNLGTG